ncbi:MAG TPA: ABC transporter substrate-binding protein [Solirubrobacteraceae bacterium]|nr:ABC transporter substrate-binding protein [Solirubrobacteraceae bacterium]
MRNRTIRLAAGGLLAAASIGIAGVTQASAASTHGGTLTVGIAEASNSLDPTAAAPPDYIYYAYDPLIYETSSGNFIADLAISWTEVGKSNEHFRLTLRHGVHFSDGSLMTASDVAKSLTYYATTPGPNQTNAGPVKNVQAIGKWTVQINYKSPIPEADVTQSLSQDFTFGDIIGPKGLADPSSLGTSTDGAGEYELEPSATVAGSKYTFVPNPHYWNKSLIRYSKVVAEFYASDSAELSAIQSGQIQYAQNMPATDVASGKSSGLRISHGPGNVPMLMLEGHLSGPLSNVNVRQAIGYALNRKAIASAVFSGLAKPQGELGVAGLPGYDPTAANLYSYDISKAKQLLAKGGYPHGFTMTLLDAAALDKGGTLAQAVESQLSAIGINVQVTLNTGSFGAFLQQLGSKNYEALLFPPRAQDIWGEATQTLLPVQGGIGNVFGASDKLLNQRLAANAAATTLAAQSSTAIAVTRRLDELAWYIPIVDEVSNQMTSKSVKNVVSSFDTVDLDPVAPDLNLEWQG